MRIVSLIDQEVDIERVVPISGSGKRGCACAPKAISYQFG
jgi:hypothetical protein